MLYVYTCFLIEFLKWKEDIEERNNVNFVKGTGNKKIRGKVIDYYYCSRTGFFTSVSKGVRSLKPLGSCKIGGYCTFPKTGCLT
jgi:hypothetical protein